MSPRKTAENVPTFEQAAARLDDIVARIEQPETGLEDMIALVEEGLGLIRRSRTLLTEAELRIRKLEEEPLEQPAPAKRNNKPAPQQDDGFSLL